MSEENKVPEGVDELSLLKERAVTLGLKFHPATGLEKMRKLVNDKLNPEAKEDDSEPEVVNAEASSKVPILSEAQLKQRYHQRLRKEALQLVRVVVHCRNPDKQAWHGEIITTGNAVIGSIKKFVPFDVEAGFHLPQMILDVMRDRKYQHFVKKKVPGQAPQMVSTLSNEFQIEVLKPLSKDEMEDLKHQQAVNHSID